MDSNYQEFTTIFNDFKGDLYLYISGSQGVSSAEMKVTYGQDFITMDDLITLFCEFIDENAYENIDDYLDDCDGDEDDALGEAIVDSGEYYIGTSPDNLTHIFDGMFFNLKDFEL